MEDTKIIPLEEETGFIPSFPTSRQIDEYKSFLSNYNDFIDTQLVKDIDYGVIPGVAKPSLFKPGAEKLEKLFFLTHEKTCVKEIDEPNYVEYVYRTMVYTKNGVIKATCEGSANAYENKYRYLTKFLNEATEEEKKRGEILTKTSKNGKEYQIVRIEKKDFYDMKNTIRKMAQKRSYVGAILEATNSSGRFTSDVEDMNPEDLGKPIKHIGKMITGTTSFSGGITPRQKTMINNLIKDRNASFEDVLSEFNVGSLEDLTKSQASTAIDKLLKKPVREVSEDIINQ